MQIVDNKGVLLRLRDPKRVTDLIPKSQELPNNHVLVHWGLEEARVLSNMDIKVPSPIMGKYRWPGQFKPYDHQKKLAEFLTMNQRAFNFSEQGCVDSETEYLSPEGWRKIADYTEGKVAQYHPDTRSFEFVEPKEYVKLPCENMVKIKTKYGLDQMLSPEHRVLIHDNKRPEKHVVTSADNVLKEHDDYHKGIRKGFNGSRKLGSNTVCFSGMSIPTALYGCGGDGLSMRTADLRLQVALIADGHFGSPTKRCVVRIKKERKKLRLRQLLDTSGREWSEKECSSVEGFSVFTVEAPLRKKVFDSYFWHATKVQLEIIADEVLYWDSCVTRGIRFSTSVKESADFIQYAFISTGRTARLTEHRRIRRGREEVEYTVQVRDTQNLTIRSSQTSVKKAPSTDGFKYCFRVPSTFLVFRRNGCVFASGNTGKTASAAWAADYLIQEKIVRRVLVICPVSIMETAWRNDLFKTVMHRTVDVAYGSAAKRKKIVESGAEFTIINYEGLNIVGDTILSDGTFDLIIVDEANAYKNPSTARWKRLNSLLSPNTWLWMMTGTPAAQSPEDAFGLAKLVNPSAVPRTKTAWKDKVMFKINTYKWLPKKNATDTVHSVLQPAMRFTKEECLDLPPMVYVQRDVELTRQQKKYYNAMADHLRLTSTNGDVTSANAAVNLSKLLQISSGGVIADKGQVLEFDVASRYNVLKEVMGEAKKKVIVFAQYTHVIDRLHEMLCTDGYAAEIINGKVPLGKRTQHFTNFQSDGKPDVLVIQPQAAAHGVTLTAADTIVWWGPTSSLEIWEQANARIHRSGQDQKCTVVKLQSSAAERHLYRMLEQRVNVHEKIMDLYENLLESV